MNSLIKMFSITTPVLISASAELRLNGDCVFGENFNQNEFWPSLYRAKEEQHGRGKS